MPWGNEVLVHSTHFSKSLKVPLGSSFRAIKLGWKKEIRRLPVRGISVISGMLRGWTGDMSRSWGRESGIGREMSLVTKDSNKTGESLLPVDRHLQGY